MALRWKILTDALLPLSSFRASFPECCDKTILVLHRSLTSALLRQATSSHVHPLMWNDVASSSSYVVHTTCLLDRATQLQARTPKKSQNQGVKWSKLTPPQPEADTPWHWAWWCCVSFSSPWALKVPVSENQKLLHQSSTACMFNYFHISSHSGVILDNLRLPRKLYRAFQTRLVSKLDSQDQSNPSMDRTSTPWSHVQARPSGPTSALSTSRYQQFAMAPLRSHMPVLCCLQQATNSIAPKPFGGLGVLWFPLSKLWIVLNI